MSTGSTRSTGSQPHRRYNPLTGRWLLVSPHRTKRPWQGSEESGEGRATPQYEPTCPLCPGNTRASGLVNPSYDGVYVFSNDFPALMPEPAGGAEAGEAPPRFCGADDLLCAQPVRGTCRVICFSPRHDLTLAQMSESAIVGVVSAWQEQTRELAEQYRWVQVFENKGAVMGCSNPHPHGQVWATDTLPQEPACEDEQQRRYAESVGRPMLLDYVQLECRLGTRVVVQSDAWAVVVPYWAAWPYEVLLLPKRHVQRLVDIDETDKASLAQILKRLLVRYDNLFRCAFPYSMGWHGAPTDGAEHAGWQLHAHFYPPLLRSATVRKFMVGFEMLGEPQRDLTAEDAAGVLRELSDVRSIETGGTI